MGFKIEKLEGSMAKITIDVSAEEFEAACEKAYQKNITFCLHSACCSIAFFG